MEAIQLETKYRLEIDVSRVLNDDQDEHTWLAFPFATDSILIRYILMATPSFLSHRFKAFRIDYDFSFSLFNRIMHVATLDFMFKTSCTKAIYDVCIQTQCVTIR